MDALTTTHHPVAVTPNERAGLLDLHWLFNTIKRRAIPIAAAVLIVLLLTGITYFLASPQYEASARIALDRQVAEVVPGTNAGELATDSPSVDTEVQVITSPRIVGEVVDKLNLANSPEFIKPDQMTTMTAPARREMLVERLANGVEVKREGLSYAIDISYTFPDAATAAAIVNGIAEAYVGGQKSEKSIQREGEIKLLRERIDKLKSQVQQAEANVAGYRGSTTLMNLDTDGAIGQQALAGLNSQLAQSKADQAAAEARYSAAVRGASAEATGSQVIRELRGQQAILSARKATLAQQFGPNYPEVETVNAQLAEANAQLTAETARISAGLAAELQASRQRTGALQAAVNKQQGELATANTASVRLGELTRQADAERTLYQGLLERYRQATVSQGTEQAKAYIIAKAAIPRLPATPNPLVFLLGGILAAIVAGVGVTVVLELLESGFSTRHGVEQALSIPVLASIPDLRSFDGGREAAKSPLAIGQYLAEHRGSVFSESFRSIRASLKVGQKDQVARSVAITSALPDEGKTSAALSLARSAAMAGLKVVLIDCDIRRRASSRNMRQEVDIGLVEVLKGEAAPEQGLVIDRRSGISVLPLRTSNPEDFDILASQAMRDLIKRLTNFFDLVVLDTAPVLPIADARAICAMADCAILVVRWRKTPANAVKLALGQLERAGVSVAGVVLSRVNVREQAKTGIGDEMYYFRSYKKYYST